MSSKGKYSASIRAAFLVFATVALAVLAPSLFADEGEFPTLTLRGDVMFSRGGDRFAFVRDYATGRVARLWLREGNRAPINGIIEATGRVTQDRPTLRLDDVTVKVLGDHGEIEPVETTIDSLETPPGNGRPDFFGTPVTLIARVEDVNRRRTQVQLFIRDLEGQGRGATASFPLNDRANLDESLRRGAIVRVKAVPSMDYRMDENGRYVEVFDLTLNIRGGWDVVVLNRPPWWTPVKIWSAIGLFSFLGAIMIVWIVFLQKAIVAKRRALEAEERAKCVRMNLAADLHDTIEQQLATAKLYLSGISGANGMSEQARTCVRVVGNVLAQADMEVRDMVAFLRGESSGAAGLSSELRRLAARVSESGAVRVHVNLAALPEVIASSVQRDVVFIVREAVTNAIKHGHARNVAIVSDLDAEGGGTRLCLRALNDGEKFDPRKALGPESGHFGLAGMRERAVRSGMDFSFVDEGRWCGIALGLRLKSVGGAKERMVEK